MSLCAEKFPAYSLLVPALRNVVGILLAKKQQAIEQNDEIMRLFLHELLSDLQVRFVKMHSFSLTLYFKWKSHCLFQLILDGGKMIL